MLFHPPAPVVLKVGSAEAGFGKMKVGRDESENISGELRDIGGSITRYGDFITAESFIQNKTHDIRVQRIGTHYRAYKRVSSNWKGNVGNSVLTEIEVSPKYKQWAEIVGDSLFGSSFKMDILTVDAVGIEGTDEEYILEINDTASGFAPNNEQVDMKHVRDLAIERMEQIFRV
jgi:glutathione synthase/RimK-type ligase-like ATP-grasp enzyme